MKMKKFEQILFTLCVLLLPAFLFADDYGDPKNYFKCLKDIENDVSDYSQYSSTVNFNGKLYNYIYYSGSTRNKIIVRAFEQVKDEVDFTDKKYDDIANLDVSNHYFQPAPVVFNDHLYVFLSNTDDVLSYSKYEKDLGGYQEPTSIDIGTRTVVGGMAATVVEGRLCLFFKGNSSVWCWWTKDAALKVWNKVELDFNNGGDSQERFGSLSAITVPVLRNGVTKHVAMIGYVGDKDSHIAYCRSFEFDDNGAFKQIGSAVKISDKYEYNCVALSLGNVVNDPNSTENCVQAFVKRDNKDNGYCRYRILRYESRNLLDWERNEQNLVKCNYEWGDHEVNLSVANVNLIKDGDTSQYICLVYRGYDDWDHPLNMALAKTDRTEPLVSALAGSFNPGEGTGITNESETNSGVKNSGLISVVGFSLSQNFPNPFYGTTKFIYQVSSEDLPSGPQCFLTRLVVYNLRGKEVATLVKECKVPGTYELEWDASQLPPGTYIYSLQSGNHREVKKLVLLK